jgi:hypothetical protein
MRMHLVPIRVIRGLALLSASSYACSDEGPRPPAEVRVTEGDGQIAPVGTLLPQPIAIAVLNADGSPAPGVQVEWRGDGDGRLLAADRATDASGRARARWQLGTSEGERRAQAVLPGLEPAVFTAIAEGPDQVPFDQVIPLEFDTYDGSHQVVHPDFVATPTGLFGRPFHLAITPYPFGNPAFENPSFFESARRSSWSLPDGAPNPIVQPKEGYLSDPDVLLVQETGELWLYYRQVAAENTIHLMRTRDGVHWSDPVMVLRAPNHQVVSPSVIRRAPDDWWMFAVNSGRAGCDAASTTVDVRRSSDGIHWSEPQGTAMTLPGFWPWHIEVQWIPSRGVFWALYNAKSGAGCVTPALYIAESTDGFSWSVVGRPVITKGAAPTLQDIVYRSTFEYDSRADAITFWYSGARFDRGRYVWGAAVERRLRSAVFAPAAALVDPRSFTPAPAPLTDWP